MLRFLFPGLTADRHRGRTLFEALVAEARRKDWYRVANVPDTVEGRFAMLATVMALAIVRLEQGGDDARMQSVAITERFIADLDAELRQMGINDPSLGKQVRSLVRSLERRVGLWRHAIESGEGWNETVDRSVYRGRAPDGETAARAGDELRRFWAALEERDDVALIAGRIA